MWPFHKKPKEPLDRLSIAAIGEEAAARLLRSQGYRVLERNSRSRCGEVDIIAVQKDELVFVEVKSRTSEEFGTPAQNVGKTKQKKLSRLAQGYVANKIGKEVPWRYDIVEVWLSTDGKVQKTNVIPGAFRPGY